MAFNTYQQELTNRIATSLLNDQLKNYDGIYSFGIRPSKLYGDQAQIVSKGLLVGKDFDINDTDMYATLPDQATAQLIPINFKKIYQDVYNEVELYAALMAGELPLFVALVTKRLADSIRVDLEKHFDILLAQYINDNQQFIVATADPTSESEQALKDINTKIYEASKPNKDNKKLEDGVLPFGEAQLLILSKVLAGWDIDITGKLFNPNPAIKSPFKSMLLLNPNAFDEDEVGTGIPYGYAMASDFIFIMDVLTKYFNTFNSQNMSNYLKHHYHSRTGLDESQIVYQFRYNMT